LKKVLIYMFLALLCVILIACEADDSVPLYKYYENKLAVMEQRIMAEEGITSEDISLSIEEVKKKYKSQPENDDELLGGIYLGYEQQNQDQANKIITIADQLIKSLYNWDYTRSNSSDIKDASCLMADDLSDAIVQNSVFNDLIDKFNEFKGCSLIRNAEIMPENYVEVFKTQSGDLIYRVWAYLIIDIKADDEFYLALPQYTAGDTTIELWLYLSKEDMTDDYKLFMWRENFNYTNYQMLYSSKFIGDPSEVSSKPYFSK